MNFENTFKNKKVFVTGHTGFKGSWLVAWLHLLGAEIKGYALAPINEFDLYYQIGGDELCQSVIADIRDLKKLKNELLAFQPDFIFHLAAQPLVVESYNNPLSTHEVNVIGTANVLEVLKYLDKACIAVMITTDKVYHNLENGQAYKEDDRLGGYDPYSASKAAAEIIIDSYRKSFFNPLNHPSHLKSISVARAGNVIGGGDWAKDRIVPDIIRALINNESINIRNPEAVRPWQHVLEPLNGYLTLAAKQYEFPVKFAEAFNFGPNLSDNITVKELAEKIVSLWKKDKVVMTLNKHLLHEASLLTLDINKAKEYLNWQPHLTLSETI
jgi:CDP-glucose 4,6-dehydratase